MKALSPKLNRISAFWDQGGLRWEGHWAMRKAGNLEDDGWVEDLVLELLGNAEGGLEDGAVLGEGDLPGVQVQPSPNDVPEGEGLPVVVEIP